VSVTRRGNENVVSIKLLEHCIRKHLDKNAPRTMSVLDPVPLTIMNLNENDEIKLVNYPFPKDPHRAKPYQITLSKHLFVEKSDVRVTDTEGFYGLAPNKSVALRYAGTITCHKIITDSNGEIKEILAELVHTSYSDKCLEESNMKKPKGCLHWISDNDSVNAEVRIFEELFTVENPNEEEDFLSCVQTNSKKTLKNCKINKNIPNIVVEDKYQFERLGYFCVDRDSDLSNKKYVFNRTIGLTDKDKVKALSKKFNTSTSD